MSETKEPDQPTVQEQKSSHSQLPDQKELEKEIGDYLTRKYGQKVKIVSAGMFPHPKEDGEGEGRHDSATTPFTFDLKPEQLIAYLDEYIVQQDKAKAVLATKICTHFNKISFANKSPYPLRSSLGRIKNNILLIGPTGVGKTYIVKLIADKLGVPFVKGDATKFSETGYVGGDVDDLVRDLVRQADGDIERARYGIIYVDEIDKIAHSRHAQGLDVSRGGVQRALLKPMEETDVDLKVPHDMISQIEAMEQYRATGKRERKTINTRDVLFVMSGAFDGIEAMIQERLHKKSIGFEGDFVALKQPKSLMKKVSSEDLIAYGFEREFIGRLPITAVLEPLSKDDMVAILASPTCAIINSKKQDFLAYGIKVVFDERIYEVIAQRALLENTGARGLVSVVEEILLPFERALPSSGICHFVVDQQLVDDPEGTLEKIITLPKQQQRHQKLYAQLIGKEKKRLVEFLADKKRSFFRDSGVVLTPKRKMLLANLIVEESCDPDQLCETVVALIDHIKTWQTIMSEHCELYISFDESAVDALLDRQPCDMTVIDALCDGMLKSIEYGAKLLCQKKHADKIVIDAAGVADSEHFINALVEKSFKL